MINKKGFTIIEILAVIALIGIVAVLVIPRITDMDSKTKVKMYNAKIEKALGASYKYGIDNIDTLSNSECTNVTIGTLIRLKYLSADDDTGYQMINPKNNKSMNNVSICLKFIDGEVVSSING